jgi:peptide maturation system acyl carrier-related protein
MNKENQQGQIEERLKNIFKSRFDKDMDKYNESILDKELLGFDIGMKPRDLLYLFFDIEKEFDIKIPEKDIVEKKFNSFNNITAVIREQIRFKSA